MSYRNNGLLRPILIPKNPILNTPGVLMPTGRPGPHTTTHNPNIFKENNPRTVPHPPVKNPRRVPYVPLKSSFIPFLLSLSIHVNVLSFVDYL